MKLGLCCIALGLREKGHKFQSMTYSRFRALPRQEALQTLSDRILNNFKVTKEIINPGYLRLLATCDPTIVGRLIGKGGKTITALRLLVRCAAQIRGKRIDVEVS